jgi:hypothetical protein
MMPVPVMVVANYAKKGGKQVLRMGIAGGRRLNLQIVKGVNQQKAPKLHGNFKTRSTIINN